MPLSSIIHILRGNLLERKGRTTAAVLIIAFATAVVTAVAALNMGFLRGIRQKATEAFPPGVLMVKPRTVKVIALAFNTAVINDKVVEKISGLPGVEYAARQLALKMPLRASGEVLGQSAETDAFVVGIDTDVVKEEIDPRFTFDYNVQTTEPVPAVLPRFFLDMYNLAYAESMGLPKIDEGFALGKEFDLHLGETYLLGDTGNTAGKKQTARCRIVGLSSNPSLLSGLLIPIEHARRFNEWYTGKDAQGYSALHVKVSDIAYLDEVTTQIHQLGLVPQSKNEELRKIHLIVNSVSTLGILFAAIILAVAVVSLINMFSLIMTERRGEVGLMRAVGGSRGIVTVLFVLEVAAMALIGAALGSLGAVLLLRVADRKILESLPKITLVPDTIFHTPLSLPLLVVTAAGILCIAAVFPIIYRTTRHSPVRLIAED